MSKMGDSTNVTFDAQNMHKNRMERDLLELQALIITHFEVRKKEDDELAELKKKIQERKTEREKQIQIRKDREKERIQREREERLRKDEIEAKIKAEEDEKKKKIIQNMSANYGGYLERRKTGRKQTEREKKKKILSERRKPINIDHLGREKLIEKIHELQKWFGDLENEKYDFEDEFKKQKYEINMLRERVKIFMGAKFGKGQKQVKTLANVGAKANVFK